LMGLMVFTLLFSGQAAITVEVALPVA